MNLVLETNQSALAELCRRHGVERLEVFGSAARPDFDSNRSDIDLVVRFRDTRSSGYADRFLSFAEEVERLLGCPIDLVTERSLRNPVFINTIARDRRQLYAA